MHTQLQEILRTQSDIGWRNFQLGFWAKEWRGVQTAYAKERGRRSDGNTWDPKAQLVLWKYVLSLWQHRNEVVHGKDYEERRRLRCEAMRKKVEDVLKNPPVLGPSGKHLLEITDIKEKGHRAQKDWLRSVMIEVGKEQRQRTSVQQQQETKERLAKLRTTTENGHKVNVRKQTSIQTFLQTLTNQAETGTTTDGHAT